MDELIQYVEEQTRRESDFPEFRAGDNVTVRYKIIEGGRSPYRDEDKEDCLACGKEMAKWNATWWPKFEPLKED